MFAVAHRESARALVSFHGQLLADLFDRHAGKFPIRRTSQTLKQQQTERVNV